MKYPKNNNPQVNNLGLGIKSGSVYLPLYNKGIDFPIQNVLIFNNNIEGIGNNNHLVLYCN
mgnify:CR=1 FL=1